MQPNDTGPRRYARGAWGLALVLVLVAGGTSGPSAAVRPQEGGDGASAAGVQAAVTADLTVSHRRVHGDGRVAGFEPAPVRMRLEHRPVAGRWRTTLALADAPRAAIESPWGARVLDNPFAPARVEFDEDGQLLGLYDGAGSKMTLPGPEDRQRLQVPGHEPASLSATLDPTTATTAGGLRTVGVGILVTAQTAVAGREDLIARFGPPTGQVRGLERFALVEGDTTREVLLDPASALPVEVTVTRDGRFQSRVTASYDAVGADRHLRRYLQVERATSDGSGDVVQTAVSLTNVVVDDGVRP